MKTGEEDESVLLKLRCKLFRFETSTKEWKEKGLGDVKLLKHNETGVIRLLMRREHVLKICANHRITTELKVTEVSSKQMSWVANDFSDNQPKSELFLAKFKTDEEAKKFKSEFEKAVVASQSIKPSGSAGTRYDQFYVEKSFILCLNHLKIHLIEFALDDKTLMFKIGYRQMHFVSILKFFYIGLTFKI